MYSIRSNDKLCLHVLKFTTKITVSRIHKIAWDWLDECNRYQYFLLRIIVLLIVNPVLGSGFSNQNRSPFLSSLNCRPMMHAKVGPTSVPAFFRSVNAPVRRSISTGDLKWFVIISEINVTFPIEKWQASDHWIRWLIREKLKQRN